MENLILRIRVVWVSIVLFLSFGQLSEVCAQVTITYPSAAMDIVACDVGTELRIRITINTDIDDTAQVNLNLPLGVNYLDGTLIVTANTMGDSIVESDVSDQNAPTFKIISADLNVNDFVEFTIARTADCEAVVYSDNGGEFKDEVTVITDAGTVSDTDPNTNSYALLAASLSVQYADGGGDTILSSLPALVTNNINLRNSGLGFVDTLEYFVVVGPDIVNYELKYNGNALSVTETKDDTLFYLLTEDDYSGIFGGNGMLENGEIVDFVECYTITNCSTDNNRTEHRARWGCGGDICQTSTPINGSVVVEPDRPSVRVAVLTNEFPTCFDGVADGHYNVLFINDGPGVAAIRHVIAGFQGAIANGYNNQFIDTTTSRILLNGVDMRDIYGGYPLVEGILDQDVPCGMDVGRIGWRESDFTYGSLFLPVGDTIEFDMYFGTCCSPSCEGFYQTGLRVGLRVHDACNSQVGFPFVRNNLGTPWTQFRSEDPIVSGPVSVNDGETVDYTVEYLDVRFLDNSPVNGNAYVALQGMAPVGFVLDPSCVVAEFTNTQNGQMTNPLPQSVDYNVLTGEFDIKFSESDIPNITNSSNRYEVKIDFCFTLDCGAIVETTGSLMTNLAQNIDTTCNPECELRAACSEYPLIFFCGTGPCPLGGGNITSFRTGRTTLGLADMNDDGIWETDDLVDPADADLTRMIPGDTMCSEMSFNFLDSAMSIVNWDSAFLVENFNYGNLYSAAGIEVEVYDDGVLTGSFTNLIPIQNGGRFEYDLSPSTLGLGITYDNMDSIWVKSCYVFDLEKSDTSFHNLCDFEQKYGAGNNLNAPDSSFVTNIGNHVLRANTTNGGTRNQCTNAQSVYTLVSVYFGARGGDFINNACTPTNLTFGGEALLWGFGRSFGVDFFPNEFRQLFYMKSPGIEVPVVGDFGLLDSAIIIFNQASTSVRDTIYAIDFTDTSYIFDMSGVLSNQGGPVALRELQSSLRFRYRYVPDCNTSDDNFKAPTYYSFGHPILGPDSCLRKGIEPSRWINQSFIGRTNLLQPQQTRIAYQEEVCYEFLVDKSNASMDVPYSWIELLTPSGNIELLNGSADGVMGTEGDGGIIQLGPDSTMAATRNVEFCVALNTCQVDTFQVVYGWSCSDYPDALEIEEGCFFDTLTYFIIPENAQIQLQILDQPEPSDTLELCATDTIEVLINSAQQADLLYPQMEVIVPSGVETNLSAGYPNDMSISFEMIPSTVNGDTLTFDLTEHSLVLGDSLPGSFSNPDPANRQMILRFIIETGCDFDPDENKLGFIGRGENPCGDPAIGDGVRQPTNAINVVGGDTPYLAFPTLMPTISTITGCSDTAMINASFSVSGGITMGRDTVVITLPAGAAWAMGSLTCNSVDMGDCPDFAGIGVNDNGNNIVLLSLPAGIDDGDAVNFDFGVVQKPAAICGDTLEVLIDIVTTLDPLVCLGVACPNEIEVSLGKDTTRIIIDNVEASFENATVCAAGGFYAINGTLLIDSSDLRATDDIKVKVYCSSDLSELAGTITVMGPALEGSTIDFNAEIPALCPVGDNLVLTIDSSACTCSETEIAIPIQYLTIEAGEDVKICASKVIDLTKIGAFIRGAATSGIWTTSGDGYFGPALTYPEALTYTPGPTDIINGSVTLRLSSDNTSGLCPEAFDEVTITILNVDCGQFPWGGN